jgi:Na+/H+-dicarboxylate symporter
MALFGSNTLIRWILVAMFAGLVAGYYVNRQVEGQRFTFDRSLLNGMKEGEGKQRAEQFLKAQEDQFMANSKKAVADKFAILSDIFMHLIKMIIAPLVLAVLVTGVAKVGDFGSVGRIGLKTLLYFTTATLIALALGLVLVNIFRPGETMNLSQLNTTSTSQVVATKQTARNFIDHVIPESIFRSMAANDILPIVVFALFIGVAAASSGSYGAPLIKAFESLSHVMFKVTGYVMGFAPIGVFGAIASVVSQQGLEVLKGYLYLIACFYGGLLFFVFVILMVISSVFKIKFLSLMRAIREPALLAFSTASSESAMPKTMEALEKYGISNRIVSFVLPLGYSFNLDGSIMYMTFATVFIAQSYGIELSMADQIQMMLILLVTSKGMAGVPRASLVVIAGMLTVFHIPVEGLALLLGVDQILDMGRSATNVVGNAVASAVVARLEGEKF